MDELIFLIDAASKIAGGDAKLATMLDVKKQHVYEWRKGLRQVPLEDQALMASVAGFDPVATMARAAVQKWEGKPKGDSLMRILGKASRATGAVLGFVGASALAIYSLAPSPSHASQVQATRDNVYKRNKRYVKHLLALS
jgi:hypothetical protein